MTLYVNGEAVAQDQVDRETERLRPHYEQVFAEMEEAERERQLREWSRENVVEQALLRQAALADPEPVAEDQIEAQLRELFGRYGGRERFFEASGLGEEREGEVRRDVETRLRVERLLNRLTDSAPKPTEKRMRKFHGENAARFTAPEMIRAAHIVKHPSAGWDPEAARAEMKIVAGRLREGVSFEYLAAQMSDCPDSGGDLGYFPRGQMVERFENVVFAMEPGEISDVFETEFGLHIAKVYERRAPRPIPFDEARAEIERELGEEARQKAVEEYVDTARAKAVIEEREEAGAGAQG